MKRICKYCHKEFEGINPKVFSNHVRWCDYNKDYDHEKFLKLMKDRKKIDDDKKYGKIITLTKNCVICSKSFSYEVREKNVNPKNHKKCCSQKCSSKIGSKVFFR